MFLSNYRYTHTEHTMLIVMYMNKTGKNVILFKHNSQVIKDRINMIIFGGIHTLVKWQTFPAKCFSTDVSDAASRYEQCHHDCRLQT